jgi:hypothetical protein
VSDKIYPGLNADTDHADSLDEMLFNLYEELEKCTRELRDSTELLVTYKGAYDDAYYPSLKEHMATQKSVSAAENHAKIDVGPLKAELDKAQARFDGAVKWLASCEARLSSIQTRTNLFRTVFDVEMKGPA